MTLAENMIANLKYDAINLDTADKASAVTAETLDCTWDTLRVQWDTC